MTWLLVVGFGQLLPQKINTAWGHPFDFERPVLAIDLASTQPMTIEHPHPPTTEDVLPLARINDLEQMGRDALKRHHYTEAQRNFAAAIAHYERLQQWVDAAGSAYMLSRTYFEMGEFAAATIALDRGIAFLDDLTHPPAALQAQFQAQQGQLQYANSQTEQAIDSWEAALLFYQEIDDTVGTIATQLDLAALYHELGLYQRARQQLTTVRDDLDQIDRDRIETIELQTLNLLRLADVELMIGQQNNAQDLFEKALRLARQAQLRDAQSTLLSRLARLAYDRGDLSLAVQHYREAAAISPNRTGAIAAELGAIDSEMAINIAQDQSQTDPQASLSDPAFDVIGMPQTPQTPAINTALQAILNRMIDLPSSQAKAQLQIYLTERVRDWHHHTDRWAIARTISPLASVLELSIVVTSAITVPRHSS
ncbi:MAG: tetratricopeptide repeat protein [Coleofasciculaceae cyanobacterium RL_1_1]|nr:tetratricopeptide repeat protein [Coleofasciculaceae cyanobacterium RL_1_1]